MGNVLDSRRIMTGKDGQMYLTGADGEQIFLAEVDTFQAKIEFANIDLQPVGSYRTMAIPVGYSVTLTLTEAVIRDDLMLSSLYAALRNGDAPVFEFACKLMNRDGKYERQVFRNCIPEGSIDLARLQPGEIVKREWSFRVNAAPELQKLIEYA